MFDTQFANFVSGAQKIIDDHYQNSFPTLEVPKLVWNDGKRYIRVARKETYSHCAYAFIDKTNGDVLKPASWKAPAKHARGNIFDEFNGLKSVSAYGPAYLK